MFILPSLPLAPDRLIPSSFGYICGLHSVFFLTYLDVTELMRVCYMRVGGGNPLEPSAVRFLWPFQVALIPNDLLSIPSLIVKYVAGQIKVLADKLRGYGERNRRAHQKTIEVYLGWRRATVLDLLSLEQWLLARALEHDKPTLLFQMACDYLKQQKIVRIGTERLARMVSTARYQALEATYQILQPLLTKECCLFLDGLLEVDETLEITRLRWLQRTPTANNLGQILATLDKIAFLKRQDIADWDLSRLNPNRAKFLAKIGARATNQYLQRANQVRRYPILIAFLKQSLYNFTDDLIEMFDQRLWELYNQAKREFEKDRLKATKNINEKLKTLRDLGQVLLDSDVDDQIVRPSAFEKISPEQLQIILGETSRWIP